MIQIQTMNAISPVGLRKSLEPLPTYAVDAPEEAAPHAIIGAHCRSMHASGNAGNPAVPSPGPGPGYNNPPVADCARKGVVAFNTPGANANAGNWN